MSGLGAWIWGTSQVDDAIDKATSELVPAGSEDIALNLEICDQIRSKSVPAKDAMRALKRRLNHKNPNVQLLALSLTDICIKNGGDLFLAEVTSREFMDNLVSILKVPALNHDVKSTILRFIQNWSVALEGKPHLGYVGQVYKTLLKEGYKFPPKDLAATSSAMVDTQIAPEWIDSDVCLRCRTAFTFTNRKHHCRNCGQVFDQACSSKTMALPHFGITQEVRVCDGCYNKLTKKAEKTDKPAKQSTNVPQSARAMADAELQRAIELSLREMKLDRRPGYTPSQPSPSQWAYSEPPVVDRSTRPTNRKVAFADEDEDPDLKAAIEASLREANAPKPSAPVVVETPRAEGPAFNYDTQASVSAPLQPPLPKIPTYELEPLETDAILTFNQTVEQVQAQGGRDLSRYPAVTDLYEKASGLRPKLALSLDDAGRKEQMLSEMHEKLSQAVKLYDQILTQQVSHPRWRTTSLNPQSHQAYTATSVTPDGYNAAQWNPQQSPTSQLQYQPFGEPAATERMTSPPIQTISLPMKQPQYVYHSLPYQPHQAPYQVEQPQFMTSTNVPVSLPPPVQSPSYTQPAYMPSSSLQSTPTAKPASIPQSPPPIIQYQQPQSRPQIPTFQQQTPVPAVGSNLARHNTVAYHNLSSPPVSSPSLTHHLGRSNTVIGTSVPQRPPHQQQAPAHNVVHQQAAGPPVLPLFPSVPTSVPEPSYSIPAIAPSFEHKEERKEALLIDL